MSTAEAKEKRTRSMSPKLFARINITKTDPKDILITHMNWLRSNTFLAPLLDAYDNKEIDPKPTLLAIRDALLSHQFSEELSKASAHIKHMINGGHLREDKPIPKYTITIYCKIGNEDSESFEVDIGKVNHTHTIEDEDGKVHKEESESDMIYDAEEFQVAERIADRRLTAREDSLFAEIKNNYGPTIITTINRSDAFARTYKIRGGQAMKNMSKKTAPLRNKPKCKNDRCVGPWSMKY